MRTLLTKCILPALTRQQIPPWVLPLLSISKRLHSIYMLRMFNDCVVMLFVYCALALYMVPVSSTLNGERATRQVERRWLFGTVLLRCDALAVSPGGSRPPEQFSPS